jgi:holo-[acyl-carrier protein] synthase
MICGIGIDIVRTARMREAVDRWGEKFLGRIFTPAEISYSYAKKNPYLSLSVRFAAKEALIKALSHEMPVVLTDVEVRNQDNGRPVLHIGGKTGELFMNRGPRNIHLSLSHETEYGVACVVIEAEA